MVGCYDHWRRLVRCWRGGGGWGGGGGLFLLSSRIFLGLFLFLFKSSFMNSDLAWLIALFALFLMAFTRSQTSGSCVFLGFFVEVVSVF